MADENSIFTTTDTSEKPADVGASTTDAAPSTDSPNGQAPAAPAPGGEPAQPPASNGQAAEPAAAPQAETGDVAAPKPSDAAAAGSVESSPSDTTVGSAQSADISGPSSPASAPSAEPAVPAASDTAAAPTASPVSAPEAAAGEDKNGASTPSDAGESKPSDEPIFSHPTPAETPCAVDHRTGKPLPAEHQPEGYDAGSDDDGAQSDEVDAQPSAGYDADANVMAFADENGGLEGMLEEVRDAFADDFEAVKQSLLGMERHVVELLKSLRS